MSEKTWVYWVGLLIVAAAVVGLIGGGLNLIAPMPRLPLKKLAGDLTPIASLVVRRAAVRVIGSTVFLITGVYMMLRGRA